MRSDAAGYLSVYAFLYMIYIILHCTQKGERGYLQPWQAVMFPCSSGTVENNDKTNSVYCSSTFPSQKVEHQKAAE